MIYNIRSLVLVSILVLSVSGCAIHQKVTPVSVGSSKQICIIENKSVKDGFLNTYRGALEAKGYAVRQLPTTATITECSLTSTYTASWRWDLAMYMAYAEIKVYGEGKQIGGATYDSLRGGANMGKFISAESKIRELVDQLFPGGAGS